MENEVKIPDFLLSRLEEEYGEELKNRILDGYMAKRRTSFRINPLKGNVEETLQMLDAQGISMKPYPYMKNVYTTNKDAREFYDQDVVKDGRIYFQSLSSMLPALLLGAKEGEAILDMAAAPGGKTTLIAALTANKASITACEVNRIRAERLRYNLSHQGVSCCYVMDNDARKLDDFLSFDRILLDAPCSGSGTLSVYYPKGIHAFSEALVKNSSKIQKELLLKAVRLLKKGHEMVYSTCSVLKEENEEVLKTVLSKNLCEIVPLHPEGVPLLPSSMDGVCTVMPDEHYEGFFIAKLRKK